MTAKAITFRLPTHIIGKRIPTLTEVGMAMGSIDTTKKKEVPLDDAVKI